MSLRRILKGFPRKSLCKVSGPLSVSIRNYDMPDNIKCIKDDPDPDFYKMVEYFYYNAVTVVEPALEGYLKKHTHLSDKKRKLRVDAILKVMDWSLSLY